MAIGLVLAVLLVSSPGRAGGGVRLTGVVLLGFAVGWASLAVLSVRFTDQPQRWAAAPAVFMGSPVWLHSAGPPPCTERSAGCGRRSCSCSWSGCSCGSAGSCAAGAHGGCCTRCLPCWGSPRWAAATRRSGSPSTRGPTRRPASWSTSAGTGSTCTAPAQAARPSSWNQVAAGSPPTSRWIAPAVARDTTVCVYDRAGRGWSDATDSPQDGAQIAADLHTLLDRAQVPGPYVLAGHSFGGLYVQSFAAQFPDQVAGLVLLDSTAPKPGPALPTGTVLLRLRPRRRLGARSRPPRSRTADRPGLLQQSPAPRPGRGTRQRLDRAQPRQLHRGVRRGRHRDAAGRGPDHLNGKPLIVLTADTGNDADGNGSQQDRLATLSTNSLHRLASATHDSLVSDRADSEAASPSYPRRRDLRADRPAAGAALIGAAGPRCWTWCGTFCVRWSGSADGGPGAAPCLLSVGSGRRRHLSVCPPRTPGGATAVRLGPVRARQATAIT